MHNKDKSKMSRYRTSALSEMNEESIALKNERKKRKKLEKELAQKNIILNTFLDNIPDYMYVKDVNSRFILNNRSHMHALGVSTQQEVVGKTDLDFFPKNLAKKYFDDEQEIIKSGKALIDSEEKAINKTSGKEEWLSSTKVPIINDRGEKIGIVGITRDITDRKEADEALMSSRDMLKSAKRETDNILQNVEEGLFLLTNDLKIGSQYSASLETIFNQKNLAKNNILEILADKISRKENDSLKDYLEAMFDDSIDEVVLEELNPISQVKLNYIDQNTEKQAVKHLTFRFKRITRSSGKIIQLISTVKDVTTEVQLAEKLENSEAHKKKQMELMFSIMHVEPELLHEFMEGTEKEILNIEESLKSVDKVKDYYSVLDTVYRSVHMIKGNASLLDLNFFAEKAHDFEEKLEELKSQKQVTSTDFIGLIFKLDDIQNLLLEIKNLINQFSQIQTLFRPKRSHESKVLLTSLENFVKMTARELNKDVCLNHKMFKSDLIPFKYRILVKEILIQLIRNAVYHGIESPEERTSNSKAREGKIEISTVIDKDMLKFKVHDDGRGIQIEKLKELAKTSGKWVNKDIDSWDDRKTADTILCQGISTSDNPNLIAGRGVGMSIIQEKLSKNNGSLDFNFKQGQFCEFTIVLPYDG